jgi:hypothetical protein
MEGRVPALAPEFDEVSGQVVKEKSLSYMLLLVVPEQV